MNYQLICIGLSRAFLFMRSVLPEFDTEKPILSTQTFAWVNVIANLLSVTFFYYLYYTVLKMGFQLLSLFRTHGYTRGHFGDYFLLIMFVGHFVYDLSLCIIMPIMRLLIYRNESFCPDYYPHLFAATYYA